MSATYEQTPSPQETQFAGVLQMGVQELRDYVETALQENPVFELSDPGEEMLEDPNFARKREWLEAGDWQDSYYQGQDEEDGSRDPLSRMGYYLSDENDLSRFVLSQFIGTKLEPEVLQAVELLCDRLDDDGFLSEDPAELAASLGVSDAVISRALTELQAADPAGVGARDRTECLSLQIERHAGDHRLARIIVEQFMDELAENGYGAISRKTGASEALVREECDLIRSLNPRPGTGFSRRENLSYVTPDVLVLPGEDEELEVQVNGGGLPPLDLSVYYSNLLLETPDEEVRLYLSEKLNQARSIVENINRRQALLERWENNPALPAFAPREPEKLERIAVYLAFRYLLKAVNDGDLLGRAQFCLLGVLTVDRLSRFTELSEALRLFSREIEHDQDNLDALLDAFWQVDGLSAAALLAALSK